MVFLRASGAIGSVVEKKFTVFIPAFFCRPAGAKLFAPAGRHFSIHLFKSIKI
jgi:hypothetical protein